MFYSGNLLSSKENTNAATVRLAYERNFNEPVLITDALGNTTKIDYDTSGNPIKITDAQNTTTTLEYNAKGQVTKVTAALGTVLNNQTTLAYDPITGNLLTITDPLSHATVFAYDQAGNIVSITDANSKTTRFTYDVMNRLKAVTDADSKVTTYSYDNIGNVISVTDPNNHTTTFAYDEQNQLISSTNPLNEQRLYSYDLNRNLSLIVTPNASQIKLFHNQANLLEKKFLPAEIVSLGYDSEYNIISAQDSDSSLSFVYDPLSRLTTASTNSGFIQPATSSTYSYDLNNDLTGMTDPTGMTTNYVYDTLNRLTDIKDPANQALTHYAYDVLSRRTSKTFPNLTPLQSSAYTYDLASQLLSLSHTPLALTNTYTYDNAGNRLSKVTTLPAQPSPVTENYAYDNLYRLISTTNPDQTYTYDALGNRNPSSLTYDTANRLLDDSAFTYTYDHDGNLTKKVNKTTGETTAYGYDAQDRLTSVTSPTLNATYKYDALGRRIEKNVNGTITRYVYNGEDIVAEYDGNNNLIASYTHGPGIDEPLILDKSGQKYYYFTDGLGSITVLTDTSGNVVQSYQYDSFGNIINQSGSLTQPYTYTGREYDPETGLYYYRARYYDPKAGRFLQEDPVWDTNLYPYVGNNPINAIDPYWLLTIPYTNTWIPAGEKAGACAAGYWSNRQAQTGNWLYAIPAVLSNLWTPETSDATLWTLGGQLLADIFLVRLVPKWAHWEHARGPHKYPHIQIGDIRLKVPKWVIEIIRKDIRKIIQKIF